MKTAKNKMNKGKKQDKRLEQEQSGTKTTGGKGEGKDGRGRTGAGGNLHCFLLRAAVCRWSRGSQGRDGDGGFYRSNEKQ